MHSHQSYPSITTVIHGYEYYSTTTTNSLFARLGTDYEIRNQWFFAILEAIIVPSRHTGTGAWVNSKMYISILNNIINCHARVFYERKEKKKNEPRPSLGGKTNTEYTGSLGYNSVFRVCYITSIDRCRRDPGYVQCHRNNYMLS